MWARALCMNDSLKTGAIFEYLKKLIDDGFGAIVLNPNKNRVPEDPLIRPDRSEFFIPGKPRPKNPPKTIEVPRNDQPEKHAIYVYDTFVEKSAAEKIVIIAHSYGGICTCALLNNRPQIFEKLVCIAFTDSVHSITGADKKQTKEFLKAHACNWVESSKKIDTPEQSGSSGCRCVSSGHEKHENTSASAFPSVMKFISDRMENGHCIVCGEKSSKVCSVCKKTKYCSTNCQSKHWKDGHKNVCGGNKKNDKNEKTEKSETTSKKPC